MRDSFVARRRGECVCVRHVAGNAPELRCVCDAAQRHGAQADRERAHMPALSSIALWLWLWLWRLLCRVPCRSLGAGVVCGSVSRSGGSRSLFSLLIEEFLLAPPRRTHHRSRSCHIFSLLCRSLSSASVVVVVVCFFLFLLSSRFVTSPSHPSCLVALHPPHLQVFLLLLPQPSTPCHG